MVVVGPSLQNADARVPFLFPPPLPLIHNTKLSDPHELVILLTFSTPYYTRASLAVRTKGVSDPPLSLCACHRVAFPNRMTKGRRYKIPLDGLQNIFTISLRWSKYHAECNVRRTTTNSHRLSRLYPAIVGVFTCIDVDIFVAPPHGRLVDIDLDRSNAKLMVFQTGEGSCRPFSKICANLGNLTVF